MYVYILLRYVYIEREKDTSRIGERYCLDIPTRDGQEEDQHSLISKAYCVVSRMHMGLSLQWEIPKMIQNEWLITGKP